MTQKLLIPPTAALAQSRSSDPRANVWVSANAGSGKTHVLTERVIRLLLGGTPPARILCLTYTKAAAAVMQSRIFSRLSRWTALSDADLTAELRNLGESRVDIIHLNQARRLFARALETPGGLKIQTIHAFCESLLRQFPLEANIPGHFELMDDTAQTQAMEQVKKQLLAEIYHNPDSPLSAAFRFILQKAGEEGLAKLLRESVAKRQDLRPYSAALAENGTALLAEIFGLKAEMRQAERDGLSMAAVLSRQIKNIALFDGGDLSRIAAGGGKRAQDFAAQLKMLAAEPNAEMQLDLAQAAYFKANGEAKDPVRLFGKKLLAEWPQAEAAFAAKAAALTELADKIKAANLAELNQAAYKLIDALLRRYHNLKRQLSFLDFGDLISRALALLKRKGAGQWVQYRLDKGIDHILVDEAQDTGPEQWEIIRLLAQEFFAGEGARADLNRTVFAVGDEKQSIYSFQGAAPQDFARNGKYFESKAGNAHILFRREQLNFSFRSAQNILAAVDGLFAAPRNYQGLSAENMPTVHSAIRLNARGYVDIWQALSAEKQAEPEDWTEYMPADSADSVNPPAQLAEIIAGTIACWLKNKEILQGKNRPIRPSDIMILVRNRSGIFIHALARALKNRSVPVAGTDRLHLTDHIAVRDLMALGNFALQPRDDLSLAAALKSPLFNLSEESLLALAAARKGTLFEALAHKVSADREAGDDSAAARNLADILEKLRRWRNFADIKPVYEFYDKILAEDGGRKQFLSRLGNEAADILDAFADYCLAAQKNGLPGLQGFLQDLSQNSPEIKRELDQSRNEIRIMTVHAAKGLEAPIVFLVDGGSAVWHARLAPCLLPLPVPPPAQQQRGLPAQIYLWLPKAEYKTQAAAAALENLKAKAEEEYRRLLYVGMTRAEDRLILCGFHGARQAADTWLTLAQAALSPLAEEITGPSDSVRALRYQPEKPAQADGKAAAETAKTERKQPIIPAFFARQPEAEPILPRPLAPSGAAAAIDEAEENPALMLRSPILPADLEAGAAAMPAEQGGAAEEPPSAEIPLGAMEKGIFIHELLQYLPDIPPARQKILTKQYLRARLGAENRALAENISGHVFRILADKRFAPLFSPNSRAEAELMGIIRVKGQERAVSGRIDRLAVFEDKILFADYKTGAAPEAKSAVPPLYMRQMALYAALLQALYPQKPITSLLIYTSEAKVFSFGAAELLPLLN